MKKREKEDELRLREMGFMFTDCLLRLPVPTAEQERIARQRCGAQFDWFWLIRSPDSTPRQRRMAREKIVRQYLMYMNGFVAGWLSRVRSDPALTKDDFLADGMLSICEAAERHDFTSNSCFITLLIRILRKRLVELSVNSSIAKTRGRHTMLLLRRKQEYERRILVERGCLPTQEDVQSHLGVGGRAIRSIEEMVVCARRNTVSLDALSFSASPEELVMRLQEIHQVSQAVALLPPFPGKVVRMHYGLDGFQPHTYEEIGREIGRTRARVGQIISLAEQQLCRIFLRMRADCHTG